MVNKYTPTDISDDHDREATVDGTGASGRRRMQTGAAHVQQPRRLVDKGALHNIASAAAGSGLSSTRT